MKQHATKLTATGFALALAGVLPATGIAQAVPEPTAPANPAGAEQQNQQTNPKVKTANELEAAKKVAQESAAKAAKADTEAKKAAQDADIAAKESGEKSAASEKAKQDALNALLKAQEESAQAALDAANQLEKANGKKTAAEDAAKTATEALTKAEQAKAAADKKVADNPAPDAGELQAAKDKVTAAKKAKKVADAKAAEIEKELTEAQEKANIAQTQFQTAQEEKAKAETARQVADADVSAKQQKVAELEKKVKDLSEGESAGLQEQIKAAQEALDKAKAEVEAAKKVVEQRKAELEKAQTRATAAQGEFEAKQAAAERAEKDKEVADQAVQAAAEQITKAQQEQDRAKADFATRHGETEAAEKAAKDAKSAQQKAEKALAEAREAKEQAEAAVKAAETEVANAKKAVDEAAEKFDQGSFGFFKAMGSQAAIDILNNAQYASYTKKGDPNDATSLKNMKVTFKWIREANRLRALEGLAPLKVTDLQMAMAQSNANWSDTNMDHSVQPHKNPDALMTGENLSWGAGDGAYYANPFGDQAKFGKETKANNGTGFQYVTCHFGGKYCYPDGWYWGEKRNYDSQKANETWNGKKNTGDTGHYENLIEDFNVTGYAASTDPNGQYKPTHSQVFAKQETYTTGKAYTVDEYEQRFMEYYNSVTPEGAKQNLANAEAKLDDLQAKAKVAEEKVTSVEKAVASAQAETQAKDAAWQTAKHQEADAAAAIETAKQKVTDAENQKTTAEGEAREKEQALQAAAAAATVAQDALTKANTEADVAQKALETAQQKVKEKEAVQAEKQQALDGLTVGDALAAAQKELTQAQQELAAAKEVAQAAVTQLETATQAQKLAEQAKTAADKDLEEATTANQQAVEAVSQAENERSAAQQALNPLAEQQIAHDQLVAKAEKVAQDLKQAKAAADKANKDLEVVTKVATDLQNEQKAKRALAEKLKAIKGQSALENGLDAADSDLDNLGLPALFKTYQGADTAAKDAQKKADKLAIDAEAAKVLQKKAVEANQQAQTKLAAAQAEYNRYHQVQAAASTNRVRSFAPGETLQVHFTGFSPGSKNRVIMHSTIVDLGVHPAVGNGEFYVSVQVPKELGAHTITATNEWGESASFKFEVGEKQSTNAAGKPKANAGRQVAGEQMPVTGVSVTSLLALNSLAVITGVGLVAASRRRYQEV
ncbi:hypothetical protein [uncultured Varibaculum sp.]|uniref:hypothetical protein n=1 Tax=uncultured Varibaculum sp. TaxID=413896 RepID=UPI002598520D|nr:hypothetical protein [uncultured Varibaculum sp.]